MTKNDRSTLLRKKARQGSNLVIAFDAQILSRRWRYSGLHVYARCLLEEFRRLPVSNGSVTIRPFVADGLCDEAERLVSEAPFRPARSNLSRLRHFWRYGGSTLAALGSKADLLFSPTPNVFPLGLVPVVATIADAAPLRVPPHSFFSASLQSQRALSYLAARFSTRIITLSEYSKRDIVSLYRVPEEKVSVIYLGYHQEIFNTNHPDGKLLAELLSRFGIARPYIIHHGMIQPRKNLQRLIEAYGQAMANNRNLDAHLVLAGSLGWEHEPILRAGQELKHRGKVIFTGSLSDQEMGLLLKGSLASVIPSLNEGFCLPMIEAMACGVPTIAANASCLPEVSGGVLRYFDPLSVDDMAHSIEEILEDESIRRQLARDGLRRATFFSWAKCARETFDLLVATCEDLVR